MLFIIAGQLIIHLSYTVPGVATIIFKQSDSDVQHAWFWSLHSSCILVKCTGDFQIWLHQRLEWGQNDLLALGWFLQGMKWC
jgi:hypothetical protein